MEERIYKVLGWQHGEFADQSGKIVHYASLYCVSEFNGDPNKSYNCCGMKAHTFKCASEEVLSGINEGDIVALYFNQFQKVNYIRKAKTKE